MKHSEAFVKLVEEVRPRVKELSPQEVKEKLEKKEFFYFLDVREDNEWAQGCAHGAQHMGRGIIERDIENEIPDKGSPIVLYCGGGYRSALAADNIQKMGYTNVYSMAGGMRLWRELGYPEDQTRFND